MHGNRKYRWEEWFDRPITILERGVHYTCSQANMASMVRNAASRRKVRVRVIDTGTTIRIEVLGAVPHTNKTALAG